MTTLYRANPKVKWLAPLMGSRPLSRREIERRGFLTGPMRAKFSDLFLPVGATEDAPLEKEPPQRRGPIARRRTDND